MPKESRKKRAMGMSDWTYRHRAIFRESIRIGCLVGVTVLRAVVGGTVVRLQVDVVCFLDFVDGVLCLSNHGAEIFERHIRRFGVAVVVAADPIRIVLEETQADAAFDVVKP